MRHSDPAALDAWCAAQGQRQTVMNCRCERAGEESGERAMAARALPEHPEQERGEQRRIDEGAQLEQMLLKRLVM